MKRIITRTTLGGIFVGITWSLIYSLILRSIKITVPLEHALLYGLMIGVLLGVVNGGLLVLITNAKEHSQRDIVLTTLAMSLIIFVVAVFFSPSLILLSLNLVILICGSMYTTTYALQK